MESDRFDFQSTHSLLDHIQGLELGAIHLTQIGALMIIIKRYLRGLLLTMLMMVILALLLLWYGVIVVPR